MVPSVQDNGILDDIQKLSAATKGYAENFLLLVNELHPKFAQELVEEEKRFEKAKQDCDSEIWNYFKEIVMTKKYGIYESSKKSKSIRQRQNRRSLYFVGRENITCYWCEKPIARPRPRPGCRNFSCDNCFENIDNKQPEIGYIPKAHNRPYLPLL